MQKKTTRNIQTFHVNFFHDISYAVTLGEWDSGRDDDCIDAYTCADPIVTVKIRQTFHSNKFGRQKQHDILVFLLENPVNFTGKAT